MTKHAVVSLHNAERASYKAYVIGFLLSLACTMLAYLLTINHVLSKSWSLALIVGTLALIQAITQLTLFLHLGKESKPRFKLLVFSFMVVVVAILVGGTIWIMHNLTSRMMTTNQINTYMEKQDDGGL
ncbi:MAG TPA: cytochrome C oxidase subunit IV family protein [Candidatus Saccharimonadales bacterium]|nr:cytochrome C oxidase subunit IV family protein [Candidatus Saccharimonadales bacterium]